MEMPVSIDPAEISPAVANPAEYESMANVSPARVGAPASEYALWGFIFVAVMGFGYLGSTRRESINKLVTQISDVVKDFRGYNPEV